MGDDLAHLRIAPAGPADPRAVRISGVAPLHQEGPRKRERGLHLASAGDETLQLFPSLTIDAKTLDHGLDIIESTVGRTRRKAA